jgi:phage terminase large subunit
MTQAASDADTSVLRWRYPAKLQPLTQPARYKDAVGGRGGAKSHFYAELGILRCYAAPTRMVGIREIQLSLRDSVRQLLVDKINKFGLGGAFDVFDAEIRGKPNTSAQGSLIVFRGMQSHNAETIKSLEGFDIAWVEEAQTLSQHSLDLLRPTLRKEGSELWFSRNRRLRTDPVDVFFRQNAGQPGIVSVEVNWNDNPWFPEVLRKDMLRDYEVDPEMAEHIWGGAYGMQHGAILSRLVDRAERDGRIHDGVEYDEGGPGIEISCDLGFRDTATWWFWQRRVGGFALLDYMGDSGMDAPEWIERLQGRLNERHWSLGKIWLPHDATAKTFQTKHSGHEQFARAFGWAKVRVVPVTSKADRINAARTIIKSCEFHKTNCEVGLEGLRAWRYEWNPETLTFSREPAHDFASHPSDGYSYGCQVMQGLPDKQPNKNHPMAIANLIAEQRRKREAAE